MPAAPPPTRSGWPTRSRTNSAGSPTISPNCPTHEAIQVIARVLEPQDGVLGRVTHLVATGSHFAKDQAERGILPAEVWLALGRAANELHDIALDLDEHTELTTRPAPIPAPPPNAAPLVARRRR
ncbi:hypothetical protein SHIRM173S_09193 [Streptomyces hirsutus]